MNLINLIKYNSQVRIWGNTHRTKTKSNQSKIHQRHRDLKWKQTSWLSSSNTKKSDEVINCILCGLLLLCCEVRRLTHTCLPWRDLQADWNSRVLSRHVILPAGEGDQPAGDRKPPGECLVLLLQSFSPVWWVNTATSSRCTDRLTSKAE